MELKELYQEIILDHAKTLEIKVSEGYNQDAKAHNLFVETKFIFI